MIATNFVALRRLLYISILFTGLVWLSNCTSSRWVVESRNAVDSTSARTLEKNLFLELDTLENNPNSLRFKLLQTKKVEFDERVKMRRTVQEYRPDWFWWPIGFTTSAALIYGANTSLLPNSNPSQELTMNVVGAAVGVATLYIQQPEGEPTQTGETKMLAITSQTIQSDTSQFISSEPITVNVSISYNGKDWVNNYQTELLGAGLEVPVVDIIPISKLKTQNPGDVRITIDSKLGRQRFMVPVSNFMRPFVEFVKTAPIRQTPVISGVNQFTTLNGGSVLPLKSERDQWYNVSYGAADAYVSKKVANIIWAPIDTPINAFVQSEEAAPITSVDIDQNIPSIVNRAENSVGLFLTSSTRSENYISSDIDILKRYLNNAFGYSNQNLYDVELSDSTRLKSIGSLVEADMRIIENLSVYISATLSVGENQSLLIDDIEVSSLFNLLKRIYNTRELNLFLDLSYAKSVSDSDLLRMRTVISEIFPRSNMLVMAQADQQNHPFMSDQLNINNRYSLFTYYYCLGLKNGLREWGNLSDFIRREVNYSSRKIYDQPQEPLFWGSPNALIY